MSTFTHYLHNYSDIHDVDEDVMTISMHGGRWTDGDITGIAYREVKYHPISTFDVVASKK